MVSFADGSFMTEHNPGKECDGITHAWGYDTPYFRSCRCGRQEWYRHGTWVDANDNKEELAMLTQNEHEIMQDYDSLLKRLDAERATQDKIVLAEVKTMVSKRAFKKLCEFMFRDGSAYCFEIVDKPGTSLKNKQKEDGYWFKYAYIEQHTGYAGDDYYGKIWIPLPGGKFLQFTYEC